MIYVFGSYLGTPGQLGQILNAGGLQLAINLEELADLQHVGSQSKDDNGGYRVSTMLESIGIDWGRWFPEKHDFGNGVTRSKTQADYVTRLVTHDTGQTIEEVLEKDGVLDFSTLRLVKAPPITEGWQLYEKCWQPNTCPQENHEVHLTWVVTERPVGEFEYERIRDLTERGAPPMFAEAFKPGQHFSELRPYKPQPAQMPDFRKIM